MQGGGGTERQRHINCQKETDRQTAETKKERKKTAKKIRDAETKVQGIERERD